MHLPISDSVKLIMKNLHIIRIKSKIKLVIYVILNPRKDMQKELNEENNLVHVRRRND